MEKRRNAGFFSTSCLLSFSPYGLLTLNDPNDPNELNELNDPNLSR
jgi:hypothetical protein